jgi:N-acetylmuramoyl-L-alanine amidase
LPLQSGLNRILVPAALLLAAAALVVSAGQEEKRISVYSNIANYSLPVASHGGVDYIGLLEILEPLGSVNAQADGQKWKLRYNRIDGEFTAGAKHARIGGRDFDLTSNFLLENGRGLVPLSSLTGLLPRFLGGPVNFHADSRRLFVGSAGVHFTAQVKGSPPALVMEFTSPVNPMIATEPGMLRMQFTHEPVLGPGSSTLTFNSPVIPSATYSESNGAAEVAIRGSVPLFARFGDDGRTITIEAAPEPSAHAAEPKQSPLAAEPARQTPPVAASLTGPRKFFVVVDASHGGSEPGAALSAQLLEKDVTLALAKRLRQELESRGLPTMLLRDSDTMLTLDQRASLANSTHPAIYICIHASSDGNGVRLYTALMRNIADSRGPFLTWETAQSPFLRSSEAAEVSLAAALEKTQVPVRRLTAALRPLSNLIAPAIAVEIAPPAADVSELNSATYQQQICSSIASGIAGMRDKLEAGR